MNGDRSARSPPTLLLLTGQQGVSNPVPNVKFCSALGRGKGTGGGGGKYKGKLALSQLQAMRALAVNKTKLSNQKSLLAHPRNSPSPGLRRNQETNKAVLGSAHMYLFHKVGDGAGVVFNKMPPNETL